MVHHAPSQALARILIQAAGRGLLDAAKDLLFPATSRERSRQIIAAGFAHTPWV
jgi:hypothetical protein